MRTKWKRAFLALVVGSLVGGVTACSEEPDGAAVNLDGKRVGAMADYKAGDQFRAAQPLTFSILYGDHPYYPIKNDWLLWSELAKRTDVKLDPTVVPVLPKGDFVQKRSAMIGAGNAPMIISKVYTAEEQPFVASGAILPVSDYVDLMPNFKDKVEKWHMQPELNTLRQDDGKFYVLPGLHQDPWQDYTIAFRTDELARLGLTEPKTWDDLYTVLKAIKAAHPDGYPLSDRFQGNSILNVAAPTFGTLAGGWGYQNAYWDAAASKYVLTGATPEYRRLLEYFHKLVADGLMDPESFTQTDDQAIQKFTSGKSYAISSNAQSIPNDYRPNLAKIPGATVAKITVPAGPKGDVVNYGLRLENGLMISSKAAQSPNFVAMMQFVDWLWYSDAGEEFAKWGVQGVTYDKDTAGKRTLKPDITFVGMNPGAPKHLQKDFGFSGGVFAYGGTTELLQSTFTPEEVAFQQAILTRKKALPLPPPYPFNETEREKVSLWDASLKDYANQAALQFILGKRDMSTWDAYVRELDSKGMSQYLDVVNGAYKRFKDKNG
ncbi:extracellular solute-binding protein [Kibdelosporangium lantanae]|uniref:Extracellular solute-binding protein n=1 Tax=Kibdelosporangium lantanae TaxID=1497396 RepID=A0ABW3M446_9PSEU